MFYDLHVHTNASDGKYSELQLLNYMNKNNIEVVAFCDHGICNSDNISLIKKSYFREYNDKLNVEIIPSIEINTYSKIYRKVHILGYGIKDNVLVTEKLKEYQRKNVKATKEQIDKINSVYNVNITEDMVKEIEKTDDISSKGIKLILMKLGLVNNVRETYKFFNHDSFTHVRREKMSDLETIRLIHDAGGVAVLAHPIEILRKDNNCKIGYGEEYKRYLNYLVLNGLDGVESHTIKHNEVEQQKYYQINKEFNILSTAGTDFHDEIRNLQLGIDYNPEIFLFPLLDKIKNKSKYKYKENMIEDDSDYYEK